jgi:hypothetical protein
VAIWSRTERDQVSQAVGAEVERQPDLRAEHRLAMLRAAAARFGRFQERRHMRDVHHIADEDAAPRRRKIDGQGISVREAETGGVDDDVDRSIGRGIRDGEVGVRS